MGASSKTPQFASKQDEAIAMIDEVDPIMGLEQDAALDEIRDAELEEAQLYYFDHPVQWIEDHVGIQFDAWQAEAIEQLLIKKFVAVRSGHGVGKSTLMSLVGLFFSATRPFSKVICTAPTKEQLFDVLWAEFAHWIKESKTLDQLFKWTSDKIYNKAHPEDWFIVARTAEVRKQGRSGVVVAESLAGRHAENHLVLIDEGSGIEEPVMDTLLGSLTTENCYVLMAGNPTRSTGTFYDAFHTKRDNWHTIHISSEDSPRVTKSYLERALNEYGSRDNPMYLIRVRGEFPPGQHNSLYPLDLIEEACVVDLRASEYDLVQIGLDVARYGDDDTAVCVRRGPEVLEMNTFSRRSTMETAGIAIQYINKYRPYAVLVDVVGVGGGTYDRLRELGYREVLAYNSSSSPQDVKHFGNLRAETHWALRTLLEKRTIKLPGSRDGRGHIIANDKLIKQMTSITYEHKSNGKMYVESKEQLRERGVKSPDLLDALVMAFAPAQVQVGRTHFTNYSFMGR